MNKLIREGEISTPPSEAYLKQNVTAQLSVAQPLYLPAKVLSSKMNHQEFNKAFDKLTRQQFRILRKVLDGETDETTAQRLYITKATVRQHVQEICRTFGLKNEPGEHYSLRPKLIEIFAKYKPEFVNLKLLPKHTSLIPVPVLEQPAHLGEVKESTFDTMYIERPPYEVQCFEAILQPGSLVRIKAPQQMGKTLLLERVLHQARKQGYQTVTLSFQLADRTVLTDLRKFLQWFCASAGQKLGLSNKLADYWDDIFGCNSNTTAYFQDYLLPTVASPLVLALDHVDLVFEHTNIGNDFCRLLRGWYDLARRGDRTSHLWRQLRLMVVHSTEVYSSLDINHSPLGGVGLVIELPEFKSEQVQELARFYRLDWSSAQVEQLMAMVGGHPYLVQVALEQIKRQEVSLTHLLQTAPTEASIYSDHLRRHLWSLQQQPELAAAFREVVTANEWVKLKPDHVFKLYSMGLVKLQGNEVMPRCDLYRQYFRDRLS